MERMKIEEMKKGKKRQLEEKMNEIEVGQLDRDIAKADLQIEKLKMEKRRVGRSSRRNAGE